MSMRRVFEMAASEQSEAWRVAAVTAAHAHQTAYTAERVADVGGDIELYSVATWNRDGRRLVWFDRLAGQLFCAAHGERPCECNGAALIGAECIHGLQRTWSSDPNAAREMEVAARAAIERHMREAGPQALEDLGSRHYE